MNIETAITPPPAPPVQACALFTDAAPTTPEYDDTDGRPAGTLFQGAWQAYLRRVLPPVADSLD